MDKGKPKTPDDYQKWLVGQCPGWNRAAWENYYRVVTEEIRRGFEASRFWTATSDSLATFNEDYRLETEYELLTEDATPPLKIKPFASFLLKTFRGNILTNPNWPSPPVGGWVLPPDWVTSLKDLVRTRFVVRYIDGVAYLAKKLALIAQGEGVRIDVNYEAKEEGYYAAHLYVAQEYEIPREDWDTNRVTVPVEIQITTQLQDNILRLLHEYYERRRACADEPSVKWQWAYETPEFCASYLGHILHYVEAMIVQVRERHAKELTK